MPGAPSSVLVTSSGDKSLGAKDHLLLHREPLQSEAGGERLEQRLQGLHPT